MTHFGAKKIFLQIMLNIVQQYKIPETVKTK